MFDEVPSPSARMGTEPGGFPAAIIFRVTVVVTDVRVMKLERSKAFSARQISTCLGYSSPGIMYSVSWESLVSTP